MQKSIIASLLSASLFLAMSLPLHAQTPSASPSSSSVPLPILKIAPESPTQWQTGNAKQSSTALPPVPGSIPDQPVQRSTVDKILKPKPAETASTDMPNPREPQSAAQVSSPNVALVVGTNSQRIPAGTFLNVRFNNPLDSVTTPAGEPFTASLMEDFSANKNIVLPKGTLIRGRVEDVKRPTFFSKGGALYLTFDHVVLPTGDIMPLDLKLSTQNTKVNQQGAVYQDPGIPPKLGKSVHKGVDMFHKITASGVQAGKDTADGLGTIVTVPFAAIGGVLAGTAVTTGQSAVAIVGRGESATITPGDTARIDFGGSFTIPSN